ncbi:hypothetical protein L210DRAFT_3589294 [Boletus edulis BED1]|uniref:Secreted protein n=1 Tax=Boletus edulis BED1 TaxID=1328754 RepID=A0AAD4BAQ8_BOLED|nr:hypothetical protein L210DRAFT_3589294 [Boletus edulis BED1]
MSVHRYHVIILILTPFFFRVTTLPCHAACLISVTCQSADWFWSSLDQSGHSAPATDSRLVANRLPDVVSSKYLPPCSLVSVSAYKRLHS